MKLFCLPQNCPAQTGQNFAFSMMKSTPAWKKYTTAGCDGRDLYQLCTPLRGKLLLKSEENILQISHLLFWMLQAAKYLIYDFTFTFSFLFICSRLNWALFHLSGIFACERNDGQISIWNIWMPEGSVSFIIIVIIYIFYLKLFGLI